MKNPINEIEKHREQITKLQTEIAELRADRGTRDEVAERLTAWVDEQAARVPAAALVASAAVGAPDNRALRVLVQGGSELGGGDVSVTPVLSWLYGDRMKARLLEELDAHADELCSRKSARDRAAALANAEKALHAAEVAEERAIVAAEAQGLEITRRPDVRPEIILSIEAA